MATDFGIRTPQKLLKKGATRKGEKKIAEATDIDTAPILCWINDVDLYLIKGVGTEYANFLEASSADTIVQLARRNPQHLYDSLVAVKEEDHLVGRLPSAEKVQDWVQQSKERITNLNLDIKPPALSKVS